MLRFDEIEAVEWEITTRCNASCPQCPRNNYGGKVISTLPLITIDLETAKKFLPIENMKNLKSVYFCGTYGEPAVNKELVQICEWIKSFGITVGIHTNGGIQNEKWWTDLANVLDENDFVVFGIDGLEDTNHLYRKGVNWNRLVKNATAFIDAGGSAQWDFIAFRHNEHQVEDARNLSVELGFKKFNIKKTSRFINKKHELVDFWPVLDNNGNQEYILEVPSNPEYVNHQMDRYKLIEKEYGSFDAYARTTPIDCYHNKIKKISIGADGYVVPCGWLNDRLYGIEAEAHPDYERIYHLFDIAGGIEKVNLNYIDLKTIIDDTWYPVLERSWNDNTRLSRCGTMCGMKFNPVGAQNENVKYWKQNE